jgi:hypothetical protein
VWGVAQVDNLEDWVYVAPEAMMASGQDTGEGSGEENWEENDDGEKIEEVSESEAKVAEPEGEVDVEDDTPRRRQAVAREQQTMLECKADIYAFGIVALEMISLTTPYSEITTFKQLCQVKNDNTMPEDLENLAAVDEKRHRFIKACLKPYRKRFSAAQLMLRKVLHTVPPLQHFAAHRVVAYLKVRRRFAVGILL